MGGSGKESLPGLSPTSWYPGVSSSLHLHLGKEGRAVPIFLLAFRTAPRICAQRVRIQVRVRRERAEGGRECVCVEMQARYKNGQRGKNEEPRKERDEKGKKPVVLGRIGPQPV